MEQHGEGGRGDQMRQEIGGFVERRHAQAGEH